MNRQHAYKLRPSRLLTFHSRGPRQNPSFGEVLLLLFLRSNPKRRGWVEMNAMNWLRKLDRLVLNFLKLMIALRVAGRIRGSWE